MIYIASVEVSPLPGSKMSGHGIGGVVYCFIPGSSKTIAKKKLLRALEEDHYRLTKLEFLEDYDGFTWEDKKDQSKYGKLANEAFLAKKIVYGPFYTWKQDE